MESGLAERCAANGVCRVPIQSGRLAGVGHNRTYQPDPPVPGLE